MINTYAENEIDRCEFTMNTQHYSYFYRQRLHLYFKNCCGCESKFDKSGTKRVHT